MESIGRAVNGIRVLVVDDDELVLRSVARALSARGFDTRSSLGAQEALAVLETWSPDAVVTDLYMPGLSGVDLIERLRESWPWVARIAMSGASVEIEDAHCTLFSKPIEIDELSAAINVMVLHIRRQRALMIRGPDRSKVWVDSTYLEALVERAGSGLDVLGIHHDLHNVITSLAVNAEFLNARLLETVAPPVAANGEVDSLIGAAADLASSAKTAVALVGQLRRKTIDRESRGLVDLGQVVQRSWESAAATLRFRDDFHLDPFLLAVNVLGAEAELRRVFDNLFRNAIEACRGAACPRVRAVCTLDDDAGVARVLVSDNGPGIDAQIRGRLFEPFVSTRQHSGGTGLGLWVARNIARRAGGDVRVTVGPLCGASFVVELPRAASGSSS